MLGKDVALSDGKGAAEALAVEECRKWNERERQRCDDSGDIDCHNDAQRQVGLLGKAADADRRLAIVEQAECLLLHRWRVLRERSAGRRGLLRT